MPPIARRTISHRHCPKEELGKSRPLPLPAPTSSNIETLGSFNLSRSQLHTLLGRLLLQARDLALPGHILRRYYTALGGLVLAKERSLT